MKFKIDKARNCEARQLLTNNEKFIHFTQNNMSEYRRKQSFRFFDETSCSAFEKYATKLGIPPATLQLIEIDEDKGHFVISSLVADHRVPILFTEDPKIADAILGELERLYGGAIHNYSSSTRPPNNPLDKKAFAWGQVFGLPSKSDETWKLELVKKKNELMPHSSLPQGEIDYINDWFTTYRHKLDKLISRMKRREGNLTISPELFKLCPTLEADICRAALVDICDDITEIYNNHNSHCSNISELADTNEHDSEEIKCIKEFYSDIKRKIELALSDSNNLKFRAELDRCKMQISSDSDSSLDSGSSSSKNDFLSSLNEHLRIFETRVNILYLNLELQSWAQKSYESYKYALIVIKKYNALELLTRYYEFFSVIHPLVLSHIDMYNKEDYEANKHITTEHLSKLDDALDAAAGVLFGLDKIKFEDWEFQCLDRHHKIFSEGISILRSIQSSEHNQLTDESFGFESYDDESTFEFRV